MTVSLDHCGESPGFPRRTQLTSLAVAAASYKYFTNAIGCQRQLGKACVHLFQQEVVA